MFKMYLIVNSDANYICFENRLNWKILWNRSRKHLSINYGNGWIN